MGNIIKDLKIKKVASEERSLNDTLYTNGGFISEKEVEKIKKKKQ